MAGIKRLMVLVAVAGLILTSCSKDKDKKSTEMRYLGDNPIEMALLDTVVVNVDSDYPVTVTSLNEKYVTAIGDLRIKGKNVGSGEIELTNGYETASIPVNVRLFLEPTFDFGCSRDEIRALHGEPDYVVGNTAYIYGNYNDPSMFVSCTCTQMNYMFSESGEYTESHVYIIDKYDALLEKYLSENFYPLDTVEVSADSTFYYYNKKTDINIVCGRYNRANQWGDTWLFYYDADY